MPRGFTRDLRRQILSNADDPFLRVEIRRDDGLATPR